MPQSRVILGAVGGGGSKLLDGRAGRLALVQRGGLAQPPDTRVDDASHVLSLGLSLSSTSFFHVFLTVTL